MTPAHRFPEVRTPLATATIIPHLARFGPDATEGPAPTTAEAKRYVRELALSHYENFSVLSALVPGRLRDDFAAVYAFCRWSDDLGDETGSDQAARERSLELLAWWRSQLFACFDSAQGRSTTPPAHPVLVALAETIRCHSLAPEPFHHLIDAFEQDQRVTRYETWDQLMGYCALSANPVGRIVLALGGCHGRTERERLMISMSDATCTALQLINFWQDVRRDLLERDRVYIPSADTGVTAEMLREWASRPEDPVARVPYIHALRPLVQRTRELFAQGRPLPRQLASDLSPVVWLFGKGGESVLAGVERIGCATLWERPRLSKTRKAALVCSAAILSRFGRWRRSQAPGGESSAP